MRIDSYLKKIKSSCEKRQLAIKGIDAKIKELEKLGVEYGSPSFKNKKYLRIIRPTEKGSKRVFDYVGADKEKQKLALESLSRGDKHTKLLEEKKSIEKAIQELAFRLGQLNYLL